MAPDMLVASTVHPLTRKGIILQMTEMSHMPSKVAEIAAIIDKL